MRYRNTRITKTPSMSISQTFSKNSLWQLLSLILIAALIGIIIVIADTPFFAAALLLSLLVFLILVKYPELSLAVQFNGTIIYFYLLYKLGLETSRTSTGVFYSFLVASAFLGGIFLVANRPQKFRLGSIDGLFICFFSWVFLSYFMFSTGGEAAYRKITYAPLLIVAPYFCVVLSLPEKRIKKFFNYCVILASLLIIPAFYELFYNPSVVESGRFSIYEFPSGLNNPILLGITFAILLLILLVRMIEQGKLKSTYLVLMIPSTFFLLRVGSRGAAISFLVAMLFYILMIGRLRLKTKFYAVVFVGLLILGAYKFIPESTGDFYRGTLAYQENPVSSVYQRITMWKEAINDFKQSPFFGVGEGNSVHGGGFPHNILLEVSAELGILGLFMFLSMCYLTIKKAMKFIERKQNQDLNLLIKLSLLLFIYSLTESMFSGYITNQTNLFMTMGLVSSIIKIKEDA